MSLTMRKAQEHLSNPPKHKINSILDLICILAKIRNSLTNHLSRHQPIMVVVNADQREPHLIHFLRQVMRSNKWDDHAPLWCLDNIALHIDKRFVMTGAFTRSPVPVFISKRTILGNKSGDVFHPFAVFLFPHLSFDTVGFFAYDVIHQTRNRYPGSIGNLIIVFVHGNVNPAFHCRVPF